MRWSQFVQQQKQQTRRFTEVHRDEVRQIFSDKRESIVFFREFENLHLKMLGSCQPENAALAVQAASVLSRSYPIEKSTFMMELKKHAGADALSFIAVHLI